MKPMRMLSLVVLTALAGCGGSGGDKPETVTVSAPAAGSTPSAATTAAIPDAPSRARDKQIAKDALLILSDFSSGWTAKDSDEDNAKSPCRGIQDAKDATNGRESSPDFDKGDSEVSNTVYLYSDETKAKAAFEGLTNQDTRKCVGKKARDGIDDSVKDSDAKIQGETTSELNVPPVGSDSAASRVTVPYKAILDSEVDFDLIVVRVGRGISVVTAANDGGPFDDDQRDELIGISARRLDRALKQ